MLKRLLVPIVMLLLAPVVRADAPTTQRIRDVIYGRSYGTSLTLDVLAPPPSADAKHLGVMLIVSGGWFSAPESIDSPLFRWFSDGLVNRGFTVFCVVHASQPKSTIPEIIPQIARATRYIRYHAKDYAIDPDHIGVCGGSAGGHLSLMQAVAPPATDPKSTDPVDRTSAKVQAAVAFFPPTDFLNYGEKGVVALGEGTLSSFAASFDFHQFSADSHRFERIVDRDKRVDIGRAISPIYHVDAADPPILFIHGDADTLVPIQQSRTMIEKLQSAGVTCKLIEKPGAGHGWAGIEKDVPAVAQWLDEHLSDKHEARSTKSETSSKPE